MKNLNRQLLKEENLTVIVEGLGKNLNEATADVFKKIRSQVYKQIEQPIIQMETEEVTFENIEEVEKKSLLPGKKDLEVIVSAKVLLSVKYLDIYKEEN